MFDLSLTQLLANALATAVVAGILGWIMVWAADVAGDPGPRQDGRRTPNPSRHAAAIGFLSGVLFGATWIRPVQLRPHEISRPRLVFLLVPAAGLAALMLLTLACLSLRPFVHATVPGNAAFAVLSVLDAVATVSLRSTLLNLLPLPPLAAGLVWKIAAPGVARRSQRLSGLTGAMIFVLLAMGTASRTLTSLERTLFSWFGF